MASKKSNEFSTDRRTRNWVFIVYPESAPENWEDILNENHIQWICSPLHDKDINPTGEVKKPHWHVIVLFEGVKTYTQVKEISDSVMAAPPKPVASLKAHVRYFAHLDNPEKAQYSIADIRPYGGVDIANLLTPSSAERYTYIDEMCDFIEDNDITEFRQILNVARKGYKDTWFPILCDNSAYVIGQFIKSRRHSKGGKDDSDE